MARNAEPMPKDFEYWDMEGDLRSVANQAAIEIDNVIIDHANRLEAVRRLGQMLSSAVSQVENPDAPNSNLNPTTAIAVTCALSDSRQLHITQLNELMLHTNEITQDLQRLATDPVRFKAGEMENLVKMRSFCLALSKRAAAIGGALIDRKPEHPFRR